MAVIQSDKRISGDLEKARIVSKSKEWRDLDLSLKIHPIRKDIIPLRDDAAIKNALRNLLVSNFYERPFNPALGANLKGLLFEPVDNITKISLRENIERVITRFEPRVEILDIVINDIPDKNAYNIILKFLIKEYDSTESVEIILRRLR
jgi:phage baseplate assembly protein W|tara:strand:+ start:2288 stop:2734 length:447 start_codon:yes stop_codon:yes gene_type:complete